MHPMKKDSSASANAKMRRMTAHYGDANPAMKKLAPVDAQKKEGGEEAVGFGADSDKASARSDRPARRTTSANPVATYKKGGATKLAKGGRTKHKGTHVNVIVAPQGGSPPPGAGAGLPMGANPAGAMMPPPKPPMAGPGPMAPPPGAGMGMPPGAGAGPMMAGAPGGLPPGMMPPRKRGGKVAHRDQGGDMPGDETVPVRVSGTNPSKGAERTLYPQLRKHGGHADAKEDAAQIKKMVKPDALKRAAGGRLPNQKHHMTAGAVTGEGRLEKIGKKPEKPSRPQAV